MYTIFIFFRSLQVLQFYMFLEQVLQQVLTSSTSSTHVCESLLQGMLWLQLQKTHTSTDATFHASNHIIIHMHIPASNDGSGEGCGGGEHDGGPMGRLSRPFLFWSRWPSRSRRRGFVLIRVSLRPCADCTTKRPTTRSAWVRRRSPQSLKRQRNKKQKPTILNSSISPMDCEPRNIFRQ